MRGVILFLLLLHSVEVFSKPLSTKETIMRKIQKFMTSPCIIDLEKPARDSIETIKFINNVSKECNVKFDKVNFSKVNSDYIIVFKKKEVTWSLWISVGKNGLKHLTETWQTKNDSFLRKRFFESFSETLDSWGDPSEENEDETWFSWDKKEYGCGMMMLTYEYSKKYTLVSRRLEFSK